MKAYLQKSNELTSKFQVFKIEQVLKEENSHADSLAKLGSSSISKNRKSIPFMFVEKLSTCKNLEEKFEVKVIDRNSTGDQMRHKSYKKEIGKKN